MNIQVRMTSTKTGRVKNLHMSPRALLETDGVEGLIENLLSVSGCGCSHPAESNHVECDCSEEWLDSHIEIGDEIPVEHQTPRDGTVYIVENGHYVGGYFLDRPSAEREVAYTKELIETLVSSGNHRVDKTPPHITEVDVIGYGPVRREIERQANLIKSVLEKTPSSSPHREKGFSLLTRLSRLIKSLGANELGLSEYERERLDLMGKESPTTAEVCVIDLNRLLDMVNEISHTPTKKDLM